MPITITVWVAAVFVCSPLAAWLAHHFGGVQLTPVGYWAWGWSLALAPLVEEFVFRRLFQSSVQRWLRRRQPAQVGLTGMYANVLTAMVFAAAHAPSQGLAAIAWSVPALALGETWRRHRQLALCIAMHSWMNACLVFVSALAPPYP